MILPSELLLPARVISKPGAVLSLPLETVVFGNRGVVVIGKAMDSRKMLPDAWGRNGVAFFPHKGKEPTTNDVVHLIDFAKRHQATWIAGVGGGSIMDLAKAASGLYNAPNPPEYYQAGGKIESQGIPFVAVPTTAGSGAEATPNAVLTDLARNLKLSIRDNRFMARLVILDSELLMGAPLNVIRDSGLDALVQAYESYVSKHASVWTENLSLSALALLFKNLVPAHHESLLDASFMAGVALANARLGVIHGLAHPLGVLYDVPHGAVCAACLPASIAFNRDALGEKYGVLSRTAGGDFAEQVSALLKRLEFQSPFKGRVLRERESIIAETLKSGSTAANPKTVTRADVEGLLGAIFER